MCPDFTSEFETMGRNQDGREERLSLGETGPEGPSSFRRSQPPSQVSCGHRVKLLSNEGPVRVREAHIFTTRGPRGSLSTALNVVWF